MTSDSAIGSTQRLVKDARKFFRSIRIIHVSLSLLMFGTGVAGLLFSLGSDGDAQIPYFFSAYAAGVWHLVFVILCQVCLYYLQKDRSRLKNAPTWVNAYTVTCSIFVIFNVMGVVFAVVNGMCIRGQLCYYDKNHAANRSIAISLIFLHFVSILFSVFLAKKSHLIDSQLSEDITIRVNHSFSWGKSKLSKVSSSKDTTSISSSEISSIENINSASGFEGHTTEGAVVVHATATSWMDRNKSIIIQSKRSKSHPNLRKHLESNQEIEGTVFSVYSDTEDKPDEKKQRRGKRRQVISKRNRITPTKTVRDPPPYVNTECEIEIRHPPVTVKIVEQRKEQLNRSLLNVKETGLLSLSRESTAITAVDGRSNTDDSIALNQEVLKQQQMVLQKQEQIQNEQKDLMKQQELVVKQQQELNTMNQPNIPGSSTTDSFISPPPPYPGEKVDDIAL